MTEKFGPLLRDALSREDRMRLYSLNEPFGQKAGKQPSDVRIPDLANAILPVVVSGERIRPRQNESYAEYAERVGRSFHELIGLASDISPLDSKLLVTGNAVSTAIPASQLGKLQESRRAILIELDAYIPAANMDDAITEIGHKAFLQRFGSLTGAGIKVALLDSGVDLLHPYLKVAGSMSTCGEPDSIPGAHGTHCAGCLASRDPDFPGIAPGVELYSIKVLDHQGNGTPTSISLGFDKAAELDVDILSISLGFNQLPKHASGGHGWACEKGLCQLCTAAENVIDLGKIVIAAAGNMHIEADEFRALDPLQTVTEITCPGHAENAITIGALTKRDSAPAKFSSRGPARYGSLKPDLSAPGVNVTSCAPVPRSWQGTPVSDPIRDQLLRRESGTSIATPMVAGTVALMLERARSRGSSLDQAQVKKLLADAFCQRLDYPEREVGRGALRLPNIGDL
jgi:serine protease AprX